MDNPWNPSAEEVRAWARDPEAVEPVEDWQLALSDARHDALYLELAADDSCAAQRYLLGVLYLIVGDAVRTDFRSAARDDVEALLVRANAYQHPEVRVWQRRSRDLLAGRLAFDYDSWCAGGLASRPDA
jgi:hypothetical protein